MDHRLDLRPHPFGAATGLAKATPRHQQPDPPGSCGPRPQYATLSSRIHRFAIDSPLEGAGFEPSVPRKGDGFETPSERAAKPPRLVCGAPRRSSVCISTEAGPRPKLQQVTVIAGEDTRRGVHIGTPNKDLLQCINE
jgi:hypothetical protein